MRFDLHRSARQLKDLGIRQHKARAFRLRSRNIPHRRALLAAIDHLDLFGAKRLVDDRGQVVIVQKRLVDLVFVRVDMALHHVFTQPPRRVDQHDLVKPAFRVDREHDARAGQVRADHVLYADRQGDFEVIKALQLAIGDRPVGEERRQTGLAGIQQRVFSTYVQEGFLLARKTGVRQIFCRGRGTYGDRWFPLSDARTQLTIGCAYVLFGLFGPDPFGDGSTDRLARRGQRDPLGFELGENFAQHAIQTVARYETAIGV